LNSSFKARASETSAGRAGTHPASGQAGFPDGDLDWVLFDVDLHDLEDPVNRAGLLFLFLFLIPRDLDAVVLQGPALAGDPFHRRHGLKGNCRDDRRNFFQDKLIADQDRFSKPVPLPMRFSLDDFFHFFDEFFFFTDGHGGRSRQAMAGVEKPPSLFVASGSKILSPWLALP